MPRRRKSNLSRSTTNARRIRLLRAQENHEEREVRLVSSRQRMSKLRRNESSVERSSRLSSNLIRILSQRQNESHEERNNRLSADRARHFKLRHRRRNEITISDVWSEKEFSALSYDPCVDYKSDTSVSIGTLPIIRSYCSVLQWEEESKEDQGQDDDPDIKTYKEMMQRDKRRWMTADKNKDEQLSKEEFADFLHPEEAPHMQDIVITETIEDIDKDGDGKISLREYIGDMYSGGEEDEPEWVKNERDQFNTYRDKNSDGYMDKDEVKEWILPSDYNHSEAESLHLIHEADDNKDSKLSKEEILNNYDLFVGSQATDFGEALTRHDEF